MRRADNPRRTWLATGRCTFPQFAETVFIVKPLIGITTSELRPGELSTLRRHGEPPNAEMALGMTYVRAIESAGGLPVVMPPLSPYDAPELMSRFDGLVLSGGPDLAPTAYDAEPHAELGLTEPDLDAFEYAMAREALQQELPILGICRGAQAINVARGGTLHQHLPDVVGDTIVHRQTEEGLQPTHSVEVMAESQLARVLGTTHLQVNSFHHQAIDVLGEGLRACAWASDATIEGIEDPTLPFLLAVQWHAETLEGQPGQTELFRALVEIAGESALLRVA
jgi:putative glutamine amidotransferase